MVTEDDIRAALATMRRDRAITVSDQAREAEMSISGFHEFVTGDKPLGLRTWRKLYRAFPDLRDDLLSYQKDAALGGGDGDDASRTDAPAAFATGPPSHASATP